MKKTVLVYITNREKLERFYISSLELIDKAEFKMCSSAAELDFNLSTDYDFVLLDTPNCFAIVNDVVIGGDPSVSAEQLIEMTKFRLGLIETELTDELIDSILSAADKQLENGVEYSDEQVRSIISACVGRVPGLEGDAKIKAAEMVFNIMRRSDVITNLLSDSEITEIMINGTNNIFIEKKGKVTETSLRFPTAERLRNLITHMVAAVGRQIDESNPIVDARLSDGSRVNAVLNPIALNGPILTIRKFPERPMKMEDMIRNSTVSADAARFIEKLVKAKYNIFISGGTGTGKTTMLNILSDYIEPDERVITIEDSAELQINHIKNLVRMETRNKNANKRGEISISDLIKTSLRMRPDRIIVGEVRREEAIDMLQAMNTGHDGSISTGHANSAADMMRRLETMVCSASANMPVAAIRSQIESAIDIVIHLQRMRDKSRRIVEISEVRGFDENMEVRLVPLYTFRESLESTAHKLSGELVRTEEHLRNTMKLRLAGIETEEGEP